MGEKRWGGVPRACRRQIAAKGPGKPASIAYAWLRSAGFRPSLIGLPAQESWDIELFNTAFFQSSHAG
ncbi:MAG: hypothetical protein EBZ65_10195 [Betaproteobacteria bacterium]|nr:hypothetical protein [Betaproteobacteria bacterium]